jgi:hypothetical protein
MLSRMKALKYLMVGVMYVSLDGQSKEVPTAFVFVSKYLVLSLSELFHENRGKVFRDL